MENRILTNIKKILSRNNIAKSEELARTDILRQNKDKIDVDISQRRGLTICSGLTIAERDYILSDAMITSAIQLYLADILYICSIDNFRIISNTSTTDGDEDSENNLKVDKVTYIFKQFFDDSLTEAIAINLLNNGEIFLNTKYNKGLNKITVNETSYSRCTQLLYSDGSVSGYIASTIPIDDIAANTMYSYSLSTDSNESKFIEPKYMVRVYNPTLINSKICIELEDDTKDNELYKNVVDEDGYVYYTNSQSLLKQIYPDWLNNKLLELAVYRDRIAKSRFIQLIGLELGRTSPLVSDQIYDNVKDYFDKRAVIDLEQQTFKSVVGNEPFTDYKVYTTRNGVGQLTFDNSLNSNDANVASLADLEHNQTKLFAGLGIPKQYLGADDNGSALSNGGSLFFISEKYQKRVTAYVKRIAKGFKDCVKNILIQQGYQEYFLNWDFDIVFNIPESNEDVYRVKNARVEYVNALLELVDKINEAKSEGRPYNIEAISNALQENIAEFMDVEDEEEEETNNNSKKEEEII